MHKTLLILLVITSCTVTACTEGRNYNEFSTETTTETQQPILWKSTITPEMNIDAARTTCRDNKGYLVTEEPHIICYSQQVGETN